MAARERDGVSRPAGVAIALGAALLTGVFVAIGFPYDLLGERLGRALSGLTGSRIRIESLHPVLTLGGPAFEAQGVRIETGDGQLVDLEAVRLRPAWSLAWLRLDPAIHADLRAAFGRVVGVVTIGSSAGFDGRLEAVVLDRVPFAAFWPGTSLAGTLDAQIDLHRDAAGLEGRVDLEASDGNIVGAGLPLAIPFEQLTGVLRFGDGRFVAVDTLVAKGPLFDADVKGEIGAAPALSDAPMDLRVELMAQPRFRPSLEGFGIRTDRQGRAQIRIGGTPGTPLIR